MEENECFETPREYFPHEMNFRVPYSGINKVNINDKNAGDTGSMDHVEPTRDMTHTSESFYWNKNRGEPFIDKLYNSINPSKLNRNLESIQEISINEEYKALQEQFKAKCIALQEIQKQKMLLKDENQKLTLELAGEKKKASHINKKIKYIQENQNLLLKLKEEYKTIRAEELAKQNNQVDKDVQTNVEGEETLGENTVVVKESDLDAIQDTVQMLKQKIMDKLWMSNSDQPKIFQDEMNALQNENQSLKERLQLKIEENDKLKIEKNQKINVIEKIRKDKTVLKKIVLKLEKRQRDFIKKYQIKEKDHCRLISESERHLVQHLVKRYIVNKTSSKYRKKKKYLSKSYSKASSSIASNLVTSTSTVEKDNVAN